MRVDPLVLHEHVGVMLLHQCFCQQLSENSFSFVAAVENIRTKGRPIIQVSRTLNPEFIKG